MEDVAYPDGNHVLGEVLPNYTAHDCQGEKMQQLVVGGGRYTRESSDYFTSHQSGKNFLNSGMQEYDDF